MNYYRQGANKIEISNPTSEPLYVLFHPKETGLVQFKPTPETLSYIKVVSDTLFVWQDARWQSNHEKIFVLDDYQASMLFPEDVAMRGGCIRDGGIPDGQPVPAPKTVELNVMYANQIITIPLEMSYIPNPNYASQLKEYETYQKTRMEPLRQLGFCILVLSGLMLMAIVIAIIAFLKFVAKNLNQKPPSPFD